MSRKKYSPKREIPKTVREIGTTSTTKIAKYLSDKYDDDISSQSINMWFKDNPDVKEKLEKELSGNKEHKKGSLNIDDLKLSEKAKEITDLYEKGEPKNNIAQIVQCSERYVNIIINKYEDYKKRIENEQKESDDKIKAFHKIEPIKEQDRISQTQKTKVSTKQRVHARNRVKPKSKEKLQKIKLKLPEFERFKDAIKHCLDNSYRWTGYNINEIKEYIKGLRETIYSPPEWFKNLEKKIEGYNPFRTDILCETSIYVNMLNELYEALKRKDEKTASKIVYYISEIYLLKINKEQYIEVKEQFLKIKIEIYYVPEWLKYLEKLLDLWLISRPKEIRKLYLTTREWYEKIGIKFPDVLEPEANYVIENLADLKRTGIFEDLDYKIKHSLKIEDKIEYGHYNWNKLNPMEKTEIRIMIETEKKSIENHPYYILILEDIKYDETMKGI